MALTNLSFKELEEIIAEISIIGLSFLLVILIYLSPTATYLDLFKDILLMLIGGILAVLGTKNLALPTAREKAATENDSVVINDDEAVCDVNTEDDKVA